MTLPKGMVQAIYNDTGISQYQGMRFKLCRPLDSASAKDAVIGLNYVLP